MEFEMMILKRYKYDFVVALICIVILIGTYFQLNWTPNSGHKELEKVYDTEEALDFMKSMGERFSGIETQEITVKPPIYYFDYSGTSIAKSEMEEIFEATSEFIKGEGKENILNYYVEIYDPVNFWFLRNRPRMVIRFDVDGDKKFDHEYSSKFYKEVFVSKPGTIPEHLKEYNENVPDGYYVDTEDGYETWRYKSLD